MTQEEAIFILCSIDVPVGNKALIDNDVHQAILMAIDALNKPALPSGLDEAADAPFEARIGGKCWDDLAKAMEKE